MNQTITRDIRATNVINIPRKSKSKQNESILNDFDEDEHIVITLFAKPSTGKPYVTLSKLKKGTFEATSFLALRTYILFSDVGQAAWNE